MLGDASRICVGLVAAAVLGLGLSGVAAQETPDPTESLTLPGITGYAPATGDGPIALQGEGEVTLAAKLTAEGEDISRGLVWRIFSPEPGPDGKLPLVASAQGGTQVLSLAAGSYLVHAAFGRAGATKRITVGLEAKREDVVLDAGGLKLDAILANGKRIPASKLRFAIYESGDEDGGALIAPNVAPNSVVRLNAGTYHIVSTYGNVNAVIRSDIKVEAGKLTEAAVQHYAAEVTLKLVREAGGEAIADTSWSILTDSGDPVRESVGAYASLVLAEGSYTIIAKNRDRIYQREYTVEGGRDQEVEVLAVEAQNNQVEAEITD